MTDSVVERFARLFHVMGARFLASIVMIEHALQGFVFGGGAGGFIGTPILFLFRASGTMVASRMQVLRTIALSPWALKPLFGIVSDFLYVGGYRKLPYILATLVIAALSSLSLAFLWPLSPIVATLLFFLCFLQIAVADLLLEARYTEKTSRAPDIAPDLVSFVSGGMSLAQLVSIVVCGLLIGRAWFPLQFLYLVPVPFFLVALYPIGANWIGDEPYLYREELVCDAGGTTQTVRRDNALRNVLGRWFWYTDAASGTGRRRPLVAVPVLGLETGKARRNWRIILLSVVIGLVSLTTSLIGLADLPTLWVFLAALVGAPVMIGALFALIDGRIARIQTFVILQNMCSLSIDSAAFFFYTDDAEAYPEGPHFSPFFYVTVLGVVGTLLTVVGVALYNLCLTRWRFRSILLLSNVVYIALSLPNVFFYLRWNVGWLPDPLFVVGNEVLLVVCGVWTMMPCSIMMLQLCPEGLEATVYALLAGSSNLGSALSQYFGAFLLDALAIRPTGGRGESAQFGNMWIAALISLSLPILPLFLLPVLIPDAAQTDRLLEEPRLTEQEFQHDEIELETESDSGDTV